MASKKGQGNSEGKQPAKCRAPRVSPPVVSSSSDEEGWPAWEEIWAKIAALEQQKSNQARNGAKDNQPRCSTRAVSYTHLTLPTKA